MSAAAKPTAIKITDDHVAGIFKSEEVLMIEFFVGDWRFGTRRYLSALGAAAMLLGTLSIAPQPSQAASQTSFASPETAVDALIAAADADDAVVLVKIFGPAGAKLVHSGDRVADHEGRQKFAAAYRDNHRLEQEGGDKAVLIIGTDNWPFPIPLVKRRGAWLFDTKAGSEEILDRRIGRNELNAIEVCRAFVDAEYEYASEARDGQRGYARKFVSSPGKHDGLYWPAPPGDTQSPMGPLMASARAEGYGVDGAGGTRAPYHGYYYKILTRQGSNASDGAHDYVVRGRMIGGFALVAFPAVYGDSGVMTFIVNYDGVVYEKNLGPMTAAIARRMTDFNPDQSWKKAP